MAAEETETGTIEEATPMEDTESAAKIDPLTETGPVGKETAAQAAAAQEPAVQEQTEAPVAPTAKDTPGGKEVKPSTDSVADESAKTME